MNEPGSQEMLTTALEKLDIQVPLVESIFQLEEIISKEDQTKLFLRWTPDIEADRQQGAVSRNLMYGTEEAGISADPINPYPERGYGLKENYRYADHLQKNLALSKPGERKYYLIRGEQVLGKDGKPMIGDSVEPVIRPESIVPLAEISADATQEAYLRVLAFDAIRGTGYRKPGECMRDIRKVMSSWVLTRDIAEKGRQRALVGVDAFLKKAEADKIPPQS